MLAGKCFMIIPDDKGKYARSAQGVIFQEAESGNAGNVELNL